MTTLLIRRASTEDLPEIERMVADFVRGHPAENHPRSKAALRDAHFGERPVAHLVVAERGGERAFQVLAALDGLPVREIVRRLPPKELGRQPAE